MSDIKLNCPHTVRSLDAPETKECPYCAETILVKARKCKHCGEILDPALKMQREKQSGLLSGEEETAETEPGLEKVEYEDHPAMFRNNPFVFILLILLSAVGVGLIVFLIWWLKCRGTTLTVTSKKTILRKGILSKHINEVYHSDVRNVQIRQTLFQRIFGVGSIGIASAGEAGIEIQVAGIPRPTDVKDIIDRHKRE